MAGPFTKITNPASLPTSAVRGCAFSHDGKYLALALNSSPYVTIYSISDGVFTKLANPATLPAGDCYGCAFSPDGKYLALAHVTSPYVTIFSINSGVFTKLSNPATLPTGTAYCCAFSSDGLYLAVGHLNSPYVTIYSISSGVFTKLSNPSTLPSASTYGVLGCAFSPGTDYLYLAHSGITIYSISDGVFTKVSVTAPSGLTVGCACSPDGKYLAFPHNTSPYISIYSISDGVFTKLSSPADLPPGNGTGCAFSSDSKYLSHVSSTTPYVIIYSITDGTFSKLSVPATVPTAASRACAFSPDDSFYAIGTIASPYVLLYWANSYPVITDLAADMSSTHNDNVTISFTASDEDGDTLVYQISINGTVFQAFQTYTGAVSETIPVSNLTLGTNSILVTLNDTHTTVTGELFITRTNSTPALTGTLDRQEFNAIIGDADSDPVSWMATLNGTELYSWSEFAVAPVSINFTLTKDQINIGEENTLTISFKDSIGSSGSVDFDFVGVDYTKKNLIPFIM